ncbi:unnamed protein product [Meloidogyne enterolobii]|uniref:Uncharacterized protein n=1 Tax=Meloidogyne enterolobii TaxID=390850 RepID=A0ACB1AJI5_MELEN
MAFLRVDIYEIFSEFCLILSIFSLFNPLKKFFHPFYSEVNLIHSFVQVLDTRGFPRNRQP